MATMFGNAAQLCDEITRQIDAQAWETVLNWRQWDDEGEDKLRAELLALQAERDTLMAWLGER